MREITIKDDIVKSDMGDDYTNFTVFVDGKYHEIWSGFDRKTILVKEPITAESFEEIRKSFIPDLVHNININSGIVKEALTEEEVEELVTQIKETCYSF